MADTPTTTQKMVTTIGATVVKNLLMIAGASLASHGLISGSGVETFVSVGMVAVGAAWSFWNSYGRAIVLAKLEVWKATAQAQADALRKANVAPPTAAQIADKIPDPAVTAETVTKVVTAACLALIILALASPAVAQDSGILRNKAPSQGLKLPIDPLGLNAKTGGSGSPLSDIIGALDAKLLPDLKYAKALADKSGSKVTGPCYGAWISIIETRQSANVDAQGNTLPEPDPHLITTFEKMVELRNALQPDSDFMVKCSPVASMVRRDIISFIGVVLSGGAGLATLVPGL